MPDLSHDECKQILAEDGVELLPLLDRAYQIRKKYWGNDVLVHILNNAQNGYCPEDCSYCAQAKTSEADIDKYSIKKEKEILDEAKRAYESGAYRYCMVFAGRGPNERRINQLCDLVKTIKSNYPLEICVSAGLVDETGAQKLKDAGLDRLNHNLNTSEEHYNKICTTHTFQERIETIENADKAGLEVCSGMIVGMGESQDDIISVAKRLQHLKCKSIPINFYMPIPGTSIEKTGLTPQYCLRILSLFRILNPDAEIRMAAGREMHLRGLQAMGLYPANSLFVDGYLNTKGTNIYETLQMVEDAGFTIKSDIPLDDILKNKPADLELNIKSEAELRPTLQFN